MDEIITREISENHPDTRVRFLMAKLTRYQGYCAVKSVRLKRTTYAFRFAILLLGAASTVVLGLDSPSLAPYARNTALVLGALMTLLGGMASFLNIEEYWMRNNAITLQLKVLRDQLVYLAGSLQPVEEQRLQDILRQYHSITENNIRYWHEAIAERQSR